MRKTAAGYEQQISFLSPLRNTNEKSNYSGYIKIQAKNIYLKKKRY